MRFVLRRTLIGAAILSGTWAANAQAEDPIRAFVDSKGNVVFTNMIDENPIKPPSNPPRAAQQPAPVDLKVMSAIQPLVNSISAQHGVDPELVVAMMKTESNFNRWAVSPKGALGLMQLIPETGRRFGVRDFFDPQQNVDGGVRYLRFLLEKFNGNVDLSLAAYNAGENLVERLGRIPQIPETTNYVRRIRSIYKMKPAPALRALVASVALAAPSTPVAGVSAAAGAPANTETATASEPLKPEQPR